MVSVTFESLEDTEGPCVPQHLAHVRSCSSQECGLSLRKRTLHQVGWEAPVSGLRGEEQAPPLPLLVLPPASPLRLPVHAGDSRLFSVGMATWISLPGRYLTTLRSCACQASVQPFVPWALRLGSELLPALSVARPSCSH